MARLKKRTKKHPNSPATVAIIMIVLGALGLWWATRTMPNQPIDSSDATLQVTHDKTGDTSQSQSGAAAQLQGTAKVKDLVKGKEANDLQKGSSVDELVKDKTFQ